MDSPKLSRFLFLAAISLCIASAAAYTFNVGDEDGWTKHPSVTYEYWSEKHNFAVNDTLFFRYKYGDSVLQVTREAFNVCNNSAPIWKEDDGQSTFKLDKTGPFYFISGYRDHCDYGQKLSVNVTSGGPAPTPAPAHPPSHAPSPAPSHAPSPAPSPEHPEPTPEPSAATDVVGTPALTVALMGFVFGLIVVF